MINAIRVLLVDDHTLVRAGIRALLEEMEGVQVVGEAGDGLAALDLMATVHPNLAVMDIAMKGLGGLEAAARLRKQWPRVRIIMLSMHADEEYVARAMRIGASAYLLKGSAAGELELAVRAVMRGEIYLSPPISKQVVAGFVEGLAAERNPLAGITPRQREILQLIAQGYATKAVALRLAISPKTVETHRAQLMNNLRIHDVPGLVRFAIRAGLITADA